MNTIILALIVAAVGAAGGWWLRDNQAQAQVGTLRAECAEREASWDRQARESSEAQREAERLRRLVIYREAEDARTQAFTQARHAADLRTAADRLRNHVVALASANQAGRDPAAAAGSAAVPPPVVVRAGLCSGTDAAVDLAIAYERARAEGLTCERVYAAVRAAQ